MIESVFFLLALGFGVAGMGLLALSQKQHWNKVLASRPYAVATARALRVFGGVGFGISFALCLMVDPTPLAALVWLMVLTMSALIIAFTLAYWPRWLGD